MCAKTKKLAVLALTPPLRQHARFSQVSKYKGGGGGQGAKPVPFPTDEASAQAAPHKERHNGEQTTDAAFSMHPPDVCYANAMGNHGSAARNGRDGLLDKSMSDPKSLVAALSSSSSDSTELDGGGGGGRGGCGTSDASKHQHTTSSDVTGDSVDSGPEIGIAASLGLRAGSVGGGGGCARSTGSGEKPKDILLPGTLAGLATGGGSAAGAAAAPPQRASTAGRTGGPLISEIPSRVSASETGKEATGTGANRSSGSGSCSGSSSGAGPINDAVERGATQAGKGQGRKGNRPAVARGFLSKGTASPLYPPAGSENGSEPSAYVKLMSRSKVVDTRDLAPHEVRPLGFYLGSISQETSRQLLELPAFVA